MKSGIFREVEVGSLSVSLPSNQFLCVGVEWAEITAYRDTIRKTYLDASSHGCAFPVQRTDWDEMRVILEWGIEQSYFHTCDIVNEMIIWTLVELMGNCYVTHTTFVLIVCCALFVNNSLVHIVLNNKCLEQCALYLSADIKHLHFKYHIETTFHNKWHALCILKWLKIH